MESRTGESVELLTGRPVEGGIRFRSPEVAIGNGSGLDSAGMDSGDVDSTGTDSVIWGCSCGWPTRNSSVGYTEFFFHLHAELVGGAAKPRHELAQLACELRQLLRPEEKQGEKDEDGAVLKARHNSVP